MISFRSRVIIGAVSSRSLISRCHCLASAGITCRIGGNNRKAILSFGSHDQGLVAKVTAPVSALIESAASLPSARLKVKPSLISAESSAVAV